MEDDILTIMFVRQSGKIRSVKVEIKKLFYLAAGVISLILAFLGLIYGYYSIYRENDNLIAMVENYKYFEDQVVKADVADDKISEEAVLEKTTEIKEEKIIEEDREEQVKLVENLNGKLEEIFSTNSNSEKVSIVNFQVEKNDEKPGVKVKFTILNSNRVSKIIGSWILIGENKKENYLVYRSYPKNKVNKKGEIINYRNSNSSSITWFSIERLKPVIGKLEFDDEFGDYDAIYIYVYSDKGELISKVKYNRWILTT